MCQAYWSLRIFLCAQFFHRFWLFCYLLKMVILTSALVIAARPELTDDQLNKYPEPLDYFRGICEGLLLIITVANIVDEILDCVRWAHCIAYVSMFWCNMWKILLLQHLNSLDTADSEHMVFALSCCTFPTGLVCQRTFKTRSNTTSGSAFVLFC